MTDVPDPHRTDQPAPGSAAPDQPDAPAFDPTGLDLARRIAASAGRSVLPTGRRTGPEKRRKKTSAPGNTTARGEPVPLGDALENVISERGWGTEINVHLLLGRWAELVGPTVAEHSTPEAFRDAVVVVRTTSTNWAAQLRLMAPQLVARMNASLGQGTITAVRILGPEAPSWRHGPRTVKGRGPRDTYG